MEIHKGNSPAIEQIAPITDEAKELPFSSSSPVLAAPEAIGYGHGAEGETGQETADSGWFAYLKTRNFYVVLLLG